MIRIIGALAAAAALSTAGESLYIQGDGLEATTASVTLQGREAACANCHDGKTDGGGEGGVSAPALGWQFLSQPEPGGGGYDEASFRRALRDGIAPDGRALHVLMPRYRLTDAQAKSLIAYLQAPNSLTGLNRDEVVVATILPAIEGLREAGLAASAAMGEEFAAINARGGIHGRKLRLRLIEEKDVSGAIEDDAPLLIVASVGLGRDGPVVESLRKARIMNFAPVAALSGSEPRDQVLALLPTLADVARRLARAAVEKHGCVRILAAEDALSQEAAAATMTITEQADQCAAAVILSPPRMLSEILAKQLDGNSEALLHFYVSADQVGSSLASLPGRATVALPQATDLSLLAEYNARNTAHALAQALSTAGRNPSRYQLIARLGRARTSVEVQLWER